MVVDLDDEGRTVGESSRLAEQLPGERHPRQGLVGKPCVAGRPLVQRQSATLELLRCGTLGPGGSCVQFGDRGVLPGGGAEHFCPLRVLLGSVGVLRRHARAPLGGCRVAVGSGAVQAGGAHHPLGALRAQHDRCGDRAVRRRGGGGRGRRGTSRRGDRLASRGGCDVVAAAVEPVDVLAAESSSPPEQAGASSAIASTGSSSLDVRSITTPSATRSARRAADACRRAGGSRRASRGHRLHSSVVRSTSVP